MSTKLKFRTDINGLRAAAVITVVLYHFGIVGFSGGFVGVDVFFVISGYLMTKIVLTGLHNPGWSVLEFYLSRARRIVPALSVLCAVLLFVGWFILTPIDYALLSKHVYSSVAFFSNVVYWSEAGYFDPASRAKWLLHTWSLSVEWQFYLLYPIYLLITARLFSRHTAITWALWTAFLVSLALCLFVSNFRPLAAFYLLPTRAWEMLAGGLVFVHESTIQEWKKKKKWIAPGIIECAGIALIMVATFEFDSRSEWPGYLVLVPVVGAVLVIAAATPHSFLTGNLIFQLIGEWSYSIYLWHWPIVVFVGQGRATEPSLLIVLSGILLSIALGWLSFHLVEQPARRVLQKGGAFRQTVIFTLGLGPIVAIAAGIYAVNGVYWRYRGPNLDRILKYEAALNDWGYPSNCGRMDLFGRPRLCKIVGEQEKSVLLFGDSEIEQWWPWFVEIGRRNARHPKIVFATYGGCPPLPYVNRFTPGYRCDEFFDAVRAMALEKAYSTIVIGSVWTDYFIGAYGDANGQPALYRVNKEKRVTIAAHTSQFESVLSDFGKFIAELVQSGKRVVVILPIPGRYSDIPKNLYVAAWRGSPIPDAPIDEEAFRAYSNPIVSKLRAVAAGAGAEIIDPLLYLCKDNLCPIVSPDGSPLYKDGAHLRPFAVKEYADFLDRIVGP